MNPAQLVAAAADRELAAAAVPVEPQTTPAFVGLPPEQAGGRVVVTGHSNRQAAAESCTSASRPSSPHLGHIFAKLGIRSRKDLVTRIGAPQVRPNKARVTSRVWP